MEIIPISHPEKKASTRMQTNTMVKVVPSSIR
jgi:hypothetical protein